MAHKYERSLESLKNESARQRWDLFHRAIASAKQSNTQAMQRAEDGHGTATESEARPSNERNDPPLSIAR